MRRRIMMNEEKSRSDVLSTKKIVAILFISFLLMGCGKGQIDDTVSMPKNMVEQSPSDLVVEPVQLEFVSLVDCSGPIKSFASMFNRTSENISVHFEQNKDNRTRILADLTSGKGPDIMLVTYDDMVNLYSKGALVELTTSLAEEDQMMIWDNIMEYGTIDGNYVGVVPYINGVRTYFARKDMVDAEQWTTEKILKLKESNSSVDRLLTYQLGKMDIFFEFYSLVGADLRHTKYIDWEQKISRFEAEGFDELLEAVKEDTEDPSGGVELVKQGKILAYYFPVFSADTLFKAISDLDEPGTVVGFPTETGGKSFFYTDGLIVVNKNSKNVEAIAEFLSYILSVKNQLSNPNVFSVRKDAAKQAITEQVIYKEDGTVDKTRCLWQYSPGGFLSIPMEASAVQLQELYEDFMESVYPSGNVDEVFHIIWDEAESYFEGNKKSIDVVRAIDNRIQLLLDE